MSDYLEAGLSRVYKAGMLESFVILAYLVEDPEPISLIVSAATSKN